MPHIYKRHTFKFSWYFSIKQTLAEIFCQSTNYDKNFINQIQSILTIINNHKLFFPSRFPFLMNAWSLKHFNMAYIIWKLANDESSVVNFLQEKNVIYTVILEVCNKIMYSWFWNFKMLMESEITLKTNLKILIFR